MGKRIPFFEQHEGFGDPARIFEEQRPRPMYCVVPSIGVLFREYKLARAAGEPYEHIRDLITKQKALHASRRKRYKRVRISLAGKHNGGECGGCGLPLVKVEVVRAPNMRSWHPECFARQLAPPTGWPVPHRIRVLGSPGSHSRMEWLEVRAAYKDCCAYCGRGDVPMTKDHVIPVSRGGSDYIENIVPACKSCNSRKNARLLTEWVH